MKTKMRRYTDKMDDKQKGCNTYDLAKQVEKNSWYFNSLKIYTDYYWSDPVSGQYGTI